MIRKIAITCALILLGRTSASGVTLEWTRQLGSSSYDGAYGVSADGLGNVYITGLTRGALDGTNAGDLDAFVTKYDASGNLQWARQLGTSSFDASYGVSADGLGNVFISGITGGREDAFVSKYDAAGNLQWTRQSGPSERECCTPSAHGGVSADGLGNVYISGKTLSPGHRDPFVAKYDAAGNQQWTRQFGAGFYDQSSGVSADGLGNIYVSAAYGGEVGVAKYDAAGALQWTRQFGTSEPDTGYGVSADGLGNVYISGYTQGNLGGTNAGYASGDAFLVKYDAAGVLQWTRQLGTDRGDSALGVSADGMGNVYISGYTGGNLGGPGTGQHDAFVAKYDAAGNHQWTQQLGTSGEDWGYGVSADRLGNVYLSGETPGSLGGTNAGSSDAFVAKFNESLLGDFNGDGAVNALDLGVWKGAFRLTAAADADGDGDSDGADFFAWQRNLGASRPLAAVPEPGTLTLVALALAPFAWRRRAVPSTNDGYSAQFVAPM